MTVVDPLKDSYWKLIDSSGSFLACLRYTWVSPAIHVILEEISVRFKMKHGSWKSWTALPLQAASNQDKRCFKGMSDAREKKTHKPHKLSMKARLCLRFLQSSHPLFSSLQYTSVDACYSALAATCAPTNNFCPDSHNMDHLAIKGCKRLNYYLLGWQQWRQSQIPGHWMHCKHRNPHQIPWVLEFARSHQAEGATWHKAERKI